MIDRTEIVAVVTRYVERHSDEREHLRPLLDQLDAGLPITDRSAYPGHLTCSALVVDNDGRALRIWHNVFRKWLQPGGHLESTDASLVGAALRELAEETGIVLSVTDSLPTAPRAAGSTQDPLDIDVHAIPANRHKREAKHYHFDLRYAFRLPATAEVTLQWEEVSGFQWIPTGEITSPRIADKLNRALHQRADARTGTASAQPPVPRDRGRIGQARDLVDDDA
jgi:8-oxo-dGTP pyrophosphatase MutT (NUDIX family)